MPSEKLGIWANGGLSTAYVSIRNFQYFTSPHLIWAMRLFIYSWIAIMNFNKIPNKVIEIIILNDIDLSRMSQINNILNDLNPRDHNHNRIVIQIMKIV